MEDSEFKTYAAALVEDAHSRDAMIRLLGAVAFSIHCPTYAHFQEKANRHFTDLDFAAYFKDHEKIRETLDKFGFIEDREVAVVYARSRLIYNHPKNGLHIDVFFDKLDFCHTILWKDLLKLDSPTIPLAELLLEKMQIVQINEKDIIDTIMLLREHSLGENDQETINTKRIVSLCANDWGWWRTVTMNLNKVIQLSKTYNWLLGEDRQIVISRVEQLLSILAAAPKSLNWILRSKVGDKVKWYKEVGELVE